MQLSLYDPRTMIKGEEGAITVEQTTLRFKKKITQASSQLSQRAVKTV